MPLMKIVGSCSLYVAEFLSPLKAGYNAGSKGKGKNKDFMWSLDVRSIISLSQSQSKAECTPQSLCSEKLCMKIGGNLAPIAGKWGKI